ncbi:hypothetical protein ACEWY4_023691 [Coilia grayii]|uniref:PB1 domain-containing protein n=1 Tax=Coilia grayii TaxID=363190 RepID=A0ABD1IY72_9TELE
MSRIIANKSQSLRQLDCNAVEVKSKYGAEFRRFSVDRVKPGKFEEFYRLIMHIHRIANMEVMIGYADVHGDLLPINNDDNFCKAVTSAHPLLRIFIQKQEREWPETHRHSLAPLAQTASILGSILVNGQTFLRLQKHPSLSPLPCCTVISPPL